jgi:hypothetical protein
MAENETSKGTSIFNFSKPTVGDSIVTTPNIESVDGSNEHIINNINTPNIDINDTVSTTLSDSNQVVNKPSSSIVNNSTDSLIDIPLSEIEDYLEYLKQFDITKEQIFNVLDTLLSKGDVLWSFKLFSKIPVMFHIRPYFVNDILFKKLEDSPPKTMVVFNDTVSRYNLAGALVQYKDKKFTVNNTDSFNDALEYLSGLPFIVVAHLVKQLAIFDRVVGIATSQWSVENFTKPLQES